MEQSVDGVSSKLDSSKEVFRKVDVVSAMAADVRGSFFMFVESGCISTNIEFTLP